MGLISKIKKWIFDRFLEKNLKIKGVNDELYVDGEINTERCCVAFNYLKDMVKEIGPGLGLEERIHFYIIDVKYSNEGKFHIIDNNYKNCVCEFDSVLCSHLYRILCKDNKHRIIDNSYYLNLESTEDIKWFVRKLIESAINNYNININPCQYYHFSKIKLGSINREPDFVRFYGIGCNETNIKNDEKAKEDSIYKLFESMLSECIGYIESPTDRNVINTFKIWEEYASNILKHYNIFADSELITEIAATRYESEECKGNILFCNDENVKEPLIQFKEIGLKSENIRAIRKYLEMAKNGYCLWAKEGEDEYCIYGIDKKEKAHKYILLQFDGYRKWSIQDNKPKALLVRKGEKYSIPDIEDMELKAKESLELLLRGSRNNNILNKEKNIKQLINIVQAAKAQSHGTMIVFAHRYEAEKLTEYFSKKNRGIKLKKQVNLIKGNDDCRKELLINLSSIDGALIIDTNGLCHAVGVILDGIANEKCNMARGARYNSALTFTTNDNFENIYGFKSGKCKIFVFSEDKTVNILPDDI